MSVNSPNSTTIPTPSLQFEVRPVEYRVAKAFIEKWHYSKRMPTGKNICFGAYLGDTLYAVADYGTGVNPQQAPYLARVTGLPVDKNNLVELKRLCRIEPPMGLPLTRFLRICHLLLREQGIKFVVSFSDPAYGHNGGVYKAANFRHLGKSNAEWHLVEKNGVPRHRLYAFRHAKRKGIRLERARQELGVTRVKTVQKDRWFLVLRDIAKRIATNQLQPNGVISGTATNTRTSRRRWIGTRQKMR